MSTKRKRKVAIFSVIAVVIIVALGAMKAKAGKKEEPKLPVKVGKAEVADIQVKVTEVGTVQPEVKVDVKSAVSGKVTEILHRDGDFRLADLDRQLRLFLLAGFRLHRAEGDDDDDGDDAEDGDFPLALGAHDFPPNSLLLYSLGRTFGCSGRLIVTGTAGCAGWPSLGHQRRPKWTTARPREFATAPSDSSARRLSDAPGRWCRS